MIGQRKLGIIRATVELLIAMLLVFLASDVLYLYYMGAWRGENKIIEVSEVVLLYACIVLGLGYYIWRIWGNNIRKKTQ